ncbi:MAG: hypothetical protein ACYCW6_29675 [Candidatus Xenobia bacterium]
MFGPLVANGRRLQGLGGLVLLAAPFLVWARVPLGHLVVGIPGLFIHGFAAAAAGLLVLLLLLAGARFPGVTLLCGAAAAGVVVFDWHLIRERTPYLLDQMQLALAPLNDVLAHLSLRGLQLAPGPGDAARFTGHGLPVAAVGATLVLAGAALEACGYAPRKTVLSVLLGLPVCGECGRRLRFSMAWCPGCGQHQVHGAACSRCGAWCEEDYRWCPACGTQR